MTSGQPPANRASEQSRRLVLLFSEKKKKFALPEVLSLFNIGRLTGGFILLALFLFLFGATTHQSHALTSASVTMIGLTFVYLPFLLMGVGKGAKLGLYGLAEFMSGLSYMPMRLQDTGEASRRTFTTLGLIYSGTGRLPQAHRYFSKAASAYCPFSQSHGSPWNERNREAETLSRMGHKDQAWTCAQRNLTTSRQAFDDLNCRQFLEILQCDLIVAGSIALDYDKKEEGLAFFEEAVSLGAMETAREQKAGQPDNASLLSLYSEGLLTINQGRYSEAIATLELCSAKILQTRKAHGVNNSELLSWVHFALGQCYIRLGNRQKAQETITLLKDENMAEPPLSAERLNITLLEVDYCLASATADSATLEECREAALQKLADTIEILSHSGPVYDSFLVKATAKYIQILTDTNLVEEANLLSDHCQNMGMSTQPLLITGESRGTNKYKLPGIKATQNQANRAAVIFVTTLAGAVYNFLVSGWSTLTCLLFLASLLAFGGLVALVIQHVSNYRRRARAVAALSANKTIAVTLQAQKSSTLGWRRETFTVVEGPPYVQGRKLAMGMSDTLITVTRACHHSADKSIRARLHFESAGDKIIAVETLGKILVVKNDGE